MDARDEIPHNLAQLPMPPRRGWPWRAVWAIGLLAVATITALAFASYRQPELLLNLMGLRYCG